MAQAETRESLTLPYHEMTLEEYAATAHSQIVPRWSILAIPPETYSSDQLCQFGVEALRALAYLWGVRQDTPKRELAARIIGRAQFRAMLARETEESLRKRPRQELARLAKEAGIYHPWLNRRAIAATLIQWREESRRHAAVELAKVRHQKLVRAAARKGLVVPPENLRRYGLKPDGHREETILGVPLSRALDAAPEAIEAARSFELKDFLGWAAANERLASRLVFIAPGILADGGALFWRQVQEAYAAPELPPLFAALTGSEQQF